MMLGKSLIKEGFYDGADSISEYRQHIQEFAPKHYTKFDQRIY